MKAQIFKKPTFWLAITLLVALSLLLVSFISGGDIKTTADDNGTKDTTGGDKDDDDETDNTPSEPADDKETPLVKIDDWQYTPDSYNSDSTTGFSTRGAPKSATSGFAESASIGLAVGGANDINNFRRNIEKNYLPSPTDISHEGIFYDYFFDTGASQKCDELFCPSYSTAVSSDPFSEQTEYFLSVGLNSGITEADFQRKKLNLVVVLDISGSMSSGFNAYYYDQLSVRGRTIENNVGSGTKMEVANESLVALLDHLRPDDRLGIVLFDDSAYVAKDLRLVAETDMAAIRDHILEITPQGGTNMEAGYKAGTELLGEYKQVNPEEYENRIIFLTDAMPNLGNTNQSDLTQLAENNSEEGIYSSFIGIGLDFNTELIKAISQTQGANYYSVHSREDFKKQLDDNFEYMVTPLVFDLSLKLKASGYEIKAVYGSPEADLATGEIIKINTLFPSAREDNQTKGGLVLLHLAKIAEGAELELSVDYRDRTGGRHQSNQAVEFRDSNEAYYDNTGIRKGIVLSRFVNVMQDWLRHESNPSDPIVDYDDLGIPATRPKINLGYWERTSRPLNLPSKYRPILNGLKAYIAQEIEFLADESLNRELDLIDLILTSHVSAP